MALLGQHDTARTLGEDAHRRFCQTLGDDHPSTLVAADNMGHHLHKLSRYEDARRLNQDTLTRRRRVLGDDHPDTLLSAQRLAANLRALGRDEAARRLDQDTDIRFREIRSEDLPSDRSGFINSSGETPSSNPLMAPITYPRESDQQFPGRRRGGEWLKRWFQPLADWFT